MEIKTKIKFNEFEMYLLEELLYDYEWGYEVVKLVVTWQNKNAHEILVKAFDSENIKLYEIPFIFVKFPK